MKKIYYKSEYDSYMELMDAKRVADEDMKDEFNSDITEKTPILEDNFGGNF